MRGRPPAKNVQVVPSALISAAATGLAAKGYDEITSREIATLAGTTQAMISYYFEGKSGLFLALLDESLKNVALPLDRLAESIRPGCESPTRTLVSILFNHYCTNSQLYRIILDQASKKDSPIYKKYVAQKLPRNFVRMMRVVSAARQAGIYRPDLDVRHATFSFSCFTIAPIAFGATLDVIGFSLDELSSGPWFEFVTGLLERDFTSHI